jgi:hypothetical protein
LRLWIRIRCVNQNIEYDPDPGSNIAELLNIFRFLLRRRTLTELQDFFEVMQKLKRI